MLHGTRFPTTADIAAHEQEVLAPLEVKSAGVFNGIDSETTLNSKGTVMPGAGVIPVFQQAWQKFVQLKPIIWLFPNLKDKDYRTKIAPALEEAIFMLLGMAGIGIAYALGVDINTLWLVGLNAASRLGFVLAHWVPGYRAPPEDKRAAIKIGLVNFLITSAPFLLSLPIFNVPISITLVLSFSLLWPAIRLHTVVNLSGTKVLADLRKGWKG